MTTEQIEKAKGEGAIAVLALLENASLGQRLVIARAMRDDPLLRKLVSLGVNYIMGDRHREAAFWKLLAIKLGKGPVEQNYLIALKRMRRAERLGPHITAGTRSYKKLIHERDELYRAYEQEFGFDRVCKSVFASNVLMLEDVIKGAGRELAAEYLRSPEKEHLRKYLRYRLESDMDL